MTTRLKMNTARTTNGARSNHRRAGSRTQRQESIAPRRILVPIDFSMESTAALQYASVVAGKHGAKIALLHVVEPIEYVHDFGYGPVKRRRNVDSVKEANVRLRALGRRHLAFGQTWAAVVRSGTICEEIAKAAREMNVEMIIMPTRGFLPTKHTGPRSVAAGVVGRAGCPVLTLKTPLPPGSRQTRTT